MNTRKELNEKMKNLYDVGDVETGFNYWFWKLLNICLDIFKYKGLPDSLPQREIELNLLLTGHCFIFPKNGEIVTSVSSIYGFDKYYNPTKATYSQAVLGSKSNLKIEDYAIIYNSSLKDNCLNLPCDGSLLTFIQRYARMLADIESTINIYTVNCRITSLPVATNDVTKSSLRKFFNMLSMGKREIISDTPIIDSFRNIDATRKTTTDTLTDLLQCRDKILEMFYRDIGVKFRNPKRAQMSDNEVESDNQVLLISLDDMLGARNEGLEDFNFKYGFNASVEINERFDVTTALGGTKNDTEKLLEE